MLKMEKRIRNYAQRSEYLVKAKLQRKKKEFPKITTVSWMLCQLFIECIKKIF